MHQEIKIKKKIGAGVGEGVREWNEESMLVEYSPSMTELDGGKVLQIKSSADTFIADVQR